MGSNFSQKLHVYCEFHVQSTLLYIVVPMTNMEKKTKVEDKEASVTQTNVIRVIYLNVSIKYANTCKLG